MSVLIVDDHRPFREFFRSVLEDDGFDVIADVADAAAALAVAARLQPDVALVDVHLGDGPDGFDVARQLALLPSPPTVIVTSSRDRSAYDARIEAAPVAGFVAKDELSAAAIRGLLPRPAEPALRVLIAEDSVLFREGVVRVMQDLGFEVPCQVADGDALLECLARSDTDSELVADVAVLDIRMPPTYTTEGLDLAQRLAAERPGLGVLVLSQHLEPDFVLRLLHDQPAGRGYLLKDRVGDLHSFGDALRRVAAGGLVVDPELVRQLTGPAVEPLRDLSAREVDVLRLMAQGLSNERIGHELFLSHRTVEAHIGRIFVKFGIDRSTGQNPRVAAVLAYLSSMPGR